MPAQDSPPSFATVHAPASWRVVDFISDLHLKPEEPQTVQAWARYMRATAADAVVILGDLFEAWIGDDAAMPGSFEARCGSILDSCNAHLAFMRGNRDFLVGSDFLSRHGVLDLAADPTVLVLANGQRLLLSHGDLLCVDDTAYQAYRKQVRDPAWQAQALALPLAQRRDIARQMRAQSSALQAEMDPARYADADDALARQWLQQAGAATLIHGHTHKPADHELAPDTRDRRLRRIVLTDWHVDAQAQRAEVLRRHADGTLARLSLSQAGTHAA